MTDLISLAPRETLYVVCESCGCSYEPANPHALRHVCDGCRATDADDDRAAELTAVAS